MEEEGDIQEEDVLLSYHSPDIETTNMDNAIWEGPYSNSDEVPKDTLSRRVKRRPAYLDDCV